MNNVMRLYEYKIFPESELYELYLDAFNLGSDFDVYSVSHSCYIPIGKNKLTKDQLLSRCKRPVFNQYTQISDYSQYIQAQRQHLHALLPNGLVITLFMKYSEDEFTQTLKGKHPDPTLNRYKQMKVEEFIWNSNKIESIEVSLNDTVTILAGGTVESIQYSDRLAVENAKAAFDLRQTYNDFPFKVIDLCKIHYALMGGIREDAGMIRTYNVGVGTASHDFTDFNQVHTEILKLKNIQMGDNIILYAAKLHAALVNIHPFGDGNGRLCRLVTHPYTNIPQTLRLEYYAALDAFGAYEDFGPIYYLVKSLNQVQLTGSSLFSK